MYHLLSESFCWFPNQLLLSDWLQVPLQSYDLMMFIEPISGDLFSKFLLFIFLWIGWVPILSTIVDLFLEVWLRNYALVTSIFLYFLIFGSSQFTNLRVIIFSWWMVFNDFDWCCIVAWVSFTGWDGGYYCIMVVNWLHPLAL